MTQKYILVFLAFVVVYGLLILVTPPDPVAVARYQLSPLQIKLLSLTIVIPLIAIWAAALYGFATFRAYAQRIQKDADGKALSTIANGLGVLALGLPVTSIITSGLNYLSRTNTDFLPIATNIKNYLIVGIALLGLHIILKGALILAKIIERPYTDTNKHWRVLFLGLLGVTYTYIIFTHVPDSATDRMAFYTPPWVTLLTLVLPYLYAWYAGLTATFLITFYAQNVGGVIYKRALQLLALGVSGVVISSILYQSLKLFIDQLIGLPLVPLLLLIYVLIAAIAVGYLLMAAGAKKLKKIEEV